MTEVLTKTDEVVTEIAKQEGGKKTPEWTENQKTTWTQHISNTLYSEMEKFEKEMEHIYGEHPSKEHALKILQASETFKDKTYEEAMNILKYGTGKKENHEEGKHKDLAKRLEKHVIKETELIKEKEEIIEDQPAEQDIKEDVNKKSEPPIVEKNEETDTKKNRINEHKKSESKVWKFTKNVFNRPLEHTWLGKYLIKKLFKKK